ncbi:MAG: heat-inducible transcription repressor HrcA [Dehalococcoidia bacterium]|nr:heat-inducible transcription repressor HrcA [Dehalococcoidia bacterium]
MLSQRRESILKGIIGEYLATAVPVASLTIARIGTLGVSPATIRNDMALLEEEGYITHPYTSAGRVPSDKGYRYYLEWLMPLEALSLPYRRTILHQFHQVEGDIDEWAHLAATLLANTTNNLAIVTIPRATQPRLRHLEVLLIHPDRALLVAVLGGARVRRQVLRLTDPVSQDRINAVVLLLNDELQGLRGPQIADKSALLPNLERQIAEATARILSAEESLQLGEPIIEGRRYLMTQPEFYGGARMQELIEVLEGENPIEAVPLNTLEENSITVMIGSENSITAMQSFSVVVARYGKRSGLTGGVSVIGPTRMDYGRTIASVKYLAGVMGRMVENSSD